ncbi:hypothetical protein LSCM1_06795 [Leishmania martiniquensis]|uniref:Kinesin motor domain-containing protein n=1 Tax=Leishmania martiniquensis TaxID=1580590 RepID=A0A836KMQ1_9TRYP|nr:hypothetical protein LSCM1_06795 [Leishmania martiniquensis]
MSSPRNREGHGSASPPKRANDAAAHARSASSDHCAPKPRLANTTAMGATAEMVNKPRINGSGALQQVPHDKATPAQGATTMTLLQVFPSLFGPTAPAASPQENVSVIVRLKAARKLSSANEPLLYEVRDGALATPQMATGGLSQEGEPTSPQLHTPLTARNSDRPEEVVAFLSRPVAFAEVGTDASASTTAEVSAPPPMGASLPRAFGSSPTQSSPQLAVIRAPPTRKSSSPVDFSDTGASTTHPHLKVHSTVLGGAAAAGRSIGASGRVLTITSPTTRERRKYEFGEVLGPEVTRSALCDRLIPSIMEQVTAGYNVSVLCYGRSGIGKTRTMNALAQAVAEEIFRSHDVENDVVEMSHIQIHNNEAHNLLGSTPAGTFGTKLSRPRMGSTDICIAGGNTCLGSPPEPKVLIRSSAEMRTKMRAASRLRARLAHTASARSSGFVTLLSFYITRFLEGVPIATVRVMLTDFAATETPRESGAAGAAAGQVLAISKSLMELRQLVDFSGTEAEVRRFRDSMLATYVAPHLHSGHLVLLVTVSLEADSYDESKSSLELASDVRRRKVTKVKSGAESRLLRTIDRLYRRPNFPSGVDTADSGSACERISGRSELKGVVEVLQHRIRVLEDALKIAQQRSTVAVEQLPLTEASADAKGGMPTTEAGTDVVSLADANALQRESAYYRDLLQKREQQLLRLENTLSSTIAEASGAPPVLAGALDTSSLLVSENGSSAGDDQQKSSTPPDSEVSSDSSSAQWRSDGVDADDAHTQLQWCLCQLHSPGSRGCSGDGSDNVLNRLYDAVLRAIEQYGDVSEQLLIASRLMSGLRAQNRRLCDAMLRTSERLLAADVERQDWRAILQALTLRATTTETVVEQLRLQLFQAYTEQSIREEMTRLYLDVKPITANVDETVSGGRQTEQQVELEKVQAHQQVLCDKITELLDNVEQLTRAAAQKDVSLAALESLITPAQRTLFHTLSSTAVAISDHRTANMGDNKDQLADAAEAAMASGDEKSTADCFSLLQSRVSELSALLTQEQQQHQLTQCELLEAREDARRSRQKQRQAFFQQQEEARRVGQLMAENFELRQQNERHQLYLSEMYVHLHEQLVQLRQKHQEEVAKLRTSTREAQSPQRGTVGAVREGHESRDEDNDNAASSIVAHAPGRRHTLQVLPPGEDSPRESTELGLTAAALSTADVSCGPTAPLQRPSRGKCQPQKSKERRRGAVQGKDAPATTEGQRVASKTTSKRHLFARDGESTHTRDTTTPLIQSGVLASGSLASRRRGRASVKAGGK